MENRVFRDFLLLAFTILFVPAICQAQASLKDFQLTLENPCADITRAGWQAWLTDAPQSPCELEVGRRWENVGHPEFNGKAVVHQLEFTVPEILKGRRIGFFCSAVDDVAEVRLNDHYAGGRKFLPYLLTGSLIVELAPYIRFGEKNILTVIVRDSEATRAGGMIGSVRLFHSLPVERNTAGGLLIPAAPEEQLHLLLHLGEVRLTCGGRDRFSVGELAALRLPPGIVRDDELVLPVPVGSVAAGELPALEMNHVHPGRDQRRLALQVAIDLPTTGKGKQAKSYVMNQYDLTEWALDLQATYENPYDPQDIAVECLVTCPSGKVERVVGFFAQDFQSLSVRAEEEILLPSPGIPWRVRYRPRETGMYHFEFLAHDRSGTVRCAGGSHECRASAQKGYLRISTANPRLFEFDDGTPFYATGPGGWWRGSEFIFGSNTRWVSSALLEQWYQRKAEAGSTYEYLGTFHFGINSLPGGYLDPHVMWKTDHALRSMEKHGLKWLCFCDDLRRHLDADGIEGHPYWHANGGAARCLDDFYSHPAVLRLQENRLRYFVGRMADSPALWIWNCGDESNCQPGMKRSRVMVHQWLKHLHQTIRDYDVYRHAHAIGECLEGLHLGGDVVVLEDWYYDHAWQSQSADHHWLFKNRKDDVVANHGILEQYLVLDAPVINSEGGCGLSLKELLDDDNAVGGGLSLHSPEAKYQDVSFHTHLWISLFMQCAAGGTNWLCNAMDREKQSFHAAAISRFLLNEPLTGGRWKTVRPLAADERLHGYLLSSQFSARHLFWVTDKQYTLYNMIRAKGKIGAIQGAQVTLPVADGSWQIEWWDTVAGQPVKKDKATAKDGALRLTIPDFTRDLAAKIWRAS